MKKSNVFKFVFSRDYFKDRTIVFLFLILSTTLIINGGLVLLFTDVTEQHVPHGFNGFGVGDFDRGSGLDQYVFLLFAVVCYVSTVALSIKTFNIRKSLSILQLYLGLVVMIMLFFVERANILG